MGILDQGGQGPRERTLVPLHHQGARARMEFHAPLFREHGPQVPHGASHHRIEIQGNEGGAVLSGVGEQLLAKAGGLLGGPLDMGKGALHRGTRGQARTGDFDAGFDGGHQVGEIVGEAPGQGFHQLHFPGFGLGPGLLGAGGDVFHHGQQSLELSVRREERGVVDAEQEPSAFPVPPFPGAAGDAPVLKQIPPEGIPTPLILREEEKAQYRLPQDLRDGVAEDGLRRRIPKDDPALGVRFDESDGGLLDQEGEPRFGEPQADLPLFSRALDFQKLLRHEQLLFQEASGQGFDEVGVDAGFRQSPARQQRVVARHQDHVSVGPLPGPNVLGQSQAIGAWKLPIQEGQIEMPVLKGPPRLLSVSHRLDRVALPFQLLLERVPKDPVILGQ